MKTTLKSEVSAASYPISVTDRGVRPRARTGARWAAAPILLMTLAACVTTPVTGRTSLNLFSAQDDVVMGRQAYEEIIAQAKLVTSGPNLQMVQRVMNRLVAVADDQGYEWEVNLLDAPDVNAFALPGGKMAVYTGILPVCQSEAGLAVVMGHEIGHVVARHGTERVSLAYGSEALLSLLDSGDYGTLARMAADLVVHKPYGRSHESEGDEIGLIYMAKAGYDPREAVAFWQRMAAMTGASPPELLSTHPSHDTRVKDLEKLMPKAIALYEAAR